MNGSLDFVQPALPPAIQRDGRISSPAKAGGCPPEPYVSDVAVLALDIDDPRVTIGPDPFLNLDLVPLTTRVGNYHPLDANRIAPYTETKPGELSAVRANIKIIFLKPIRDLFCAEISPSSTLCGRHGGTSGEHNNNERPNNNAFGHVDLTSLKSMIDKNLMERLNHNRRSL